MEFSKLYRIMEDTRPLGTIQPPGQSKPVAAPIKNNVAGAPGPMAGSLNLQKLLPYFPSTDAAVVKRSVGIVMKGGESKLTTIQLMNLGKAFVDLLKADSTKTVQIMNLLKKVSQEEPDTEL
jgi:hypothetical protein